MLEHKIKRYYDYLSAGLTTFLISSPQPLPPAVPIENKSLAEPGNAPQIGIGHREVVCQK